MSEQIQVLGFGVTLDTVAVGAGCGPTVSLSFHNDSDEHSPHQHVNDYVCVVLAGGFFERQKGAWNERRNGCFFLHRAGETHHDRFGPHGAICLSLHLEEAQSRSTATDGICSTRARLVADELAVELGTGARDELAGGELAAELLGELCYRPARLKASDEMVDRVLEAISDDPLRRWRLGELAANVERHPVYLAQAFRAKTGLSIGAFQRRRRLLSLSVALRRGTTPLALLAADFGYCDQAHMNTEFRAAFGVSPGRYRSSCH